VANHEEDLVTAIVAVARSIEAARGARKGGGTFLSPGDVSDLRRCDPACPPTSFWRLLGLIPELEKRGEEAERRWAVVFKGMALMAPNVHEAAKGTAPGKVFNTTGFSSDERPIRINRLLRAEDDAFEDLFLSACRFLRSRAAPVDWRSFATLAIRRGDAERRTLARDFYSA
jgi:CRISPR type I-E-associated protein CasB/Cse2